VKSAKKAKPKSKAVKKVKTKKKSVAKRPKVSAVKKHNSMNSVKRSKKVMYVSECVPEQFIFYVKDGRILKNLNDLINSLDTMTDTVFSHHANCEKNDFSNWIRDIINEPELSVSIADKGRLNTKYEIIRFLKNRGSFKG